VAFDSAEVKEAMTAYGHMLDYQNEDHSALSWDQAVKKLMEGSCVFSSMGDWAYGEFVNAKLKDNVDFGWVSHPALRVLHGRGRRLSTGQGAPHEVAARNWLRVLGSKEAQEAFNR